MRRLWLALAICSLVAGACGAQNAATPAAPTQAPAATATAAAPSAAPASAAPTAAPTAAPAGAAGTFRFARLELFTPIFHPIAQETDNQAMVFSLIFSNLVKTGPDDKAIIPDLADSWDVSADKTEYTFHLHPGVKWHDGTAFTAQDVVFTVNQAAQFSDAYRGFPISSWKAIKGFADVATGKATTVSGISALDDNTVKITLAAANSEFLVNLASAAHSIMPQHLLKDATKANIEKIPFSTTAPVGTGPYKFVKYTPDVSVELAANADYFKGAPKIAKVFMVSVKPEAAAAQLESGELDAVFSASFFDADRLSKNASLVTLFPAPVGIQGVFFDGKKFKDKRIFQAIYYAIDRRAINDQVFGGKARILSNPPGFKDYPDINTYPYDPEKAKQLLKDANFDFSKPFRMPYTTTEFGLERIMPIVQQYLKAIGINAELDPLDGKAWLDRVLNKLDDQEMIMQFGGFEGLSPAISQAYTACDGFFVKNYGFDAKIACQLDDLYNKALTSADDAARDDLYHQIAKILNDYPMRQNWWSPPQLVVASKRLTGMEVHGKTSASLTGIESWTISP